MSQVFGDLRVNWRMNSKHVAFIKDFYQRLVGVVAKYKKTTFAVPVVFNPLSLVLHSIVTSNTLLVWSSVVSSTHVISQHSLHYTMDIPTNRQLPLQSKYADDVILDSIVYTHTPGTIRFNFRSGLSYETNIHNIDVNNQTIDVLMSRTYDV